MAGAMSCPAGGVAVGSTRVTFVTMTVMGTACAGITLFTSVSAVRFNVALGMFAVALIVLS